MNKQEYSEYKASVKAFFEHEGIQTLSRVIPEDGFSEDECPHCGQIIDCDTHFSWRACECCGSTLGGNRVHCAGVHEETGNVFCYDICVDCEYYAVYGQLDDMTMIEVSQSEDCHAEVERRMKQAREGNRPIFEECGCCGHYHPIDWYGDCRDDKHRFQWDELPENAEVIDLSDYNGK